MLPDLEQHDRTGSRRADPGLQSGGYQEIRKKGVKNTLIGAVLLGGSGSLIYYLLTRSEMPHFSTRAGKGLGILMLGAGYGLWKLVNGIIYLVRPQSEHQS